MPHMPQLKIAVIGAGSFVFGPSILYQAIIEQRLAGVELALVDVDAEIVALMAAVGKQMTEKAGIQLVISSHIPHTEALTGADFVVCSVAKQGFRRYEMDYRIVQDYAPGHLITEFGGIAGISNSLRQIAMILELVSEMQRLCPQAWLLNVANPLPRVCQAAYTRGTKTLGYCSVSLHAYSMAWQILYGESISYPFTQARERWNMTTAGLNHFVWLTHFEDKKTHDNLLPLLRQAIADGRTSGNPVSEALTRETGYLLVPADDHTRDFLPISPTTPAIIPPFHGTHDERQRRMALLRRIAQGVESFDLLLDNPSWERPMDVIAALALGRAVTLHSLDTMNQGQIPNLPRGIFVETPCVVTQEGIAPQQVVLPETVLPLCQRTALVTDTIVQAALEQRRALVHKAVELDPTIEDKIAGIRAIEACMDAHADILPPYK